MRNAGNLLSSTFVFGSITTVATNMSDAVRDVVEVERFRERITGLRNLGRTAKDGYFGVISGAATMITNITSGLTFDDQYVSQRR